MGSVPDAARPMGSFLGASRLVVPDAIPGLLESHGRLLGAKSAVMYLVDLDQRWLVALPREDGKPAEDLAIDGTLAGRAYRSIEVLDMIDADGDRYVWVPLLDGAERLGVVQFVFADGGNGDPDEIRDLTGLAGELVMTKHSYGDFFHLARRRKPLTVAAELLWQLLPPLTFGSEEVVITASFLPTGDLGGDAFDYGVDRDRSEVAIFDAMGHDLQAGLLATAAVAAYRNGRRNKLGMPETADHIHRTIATEFGANRFVTGILTSLDLATGRLCCCIAGHPPPLLLRQGRVVKALEGGSGRVGTGMPFGIGSCSEQFEVQLEPGDRVLLYTDGVTEARDASGSLFGLDHLVDLVGRTAGGDPPPETMRRLMHAVEEHNEGPMRDDGTAVMIEWRGVSSAKLII